MALRHRPCRRNTKSSMGFVVLGGAHRMLDPSFFSGEEALSATRWRSVPRLVLCRVQRAPTTVSRDKFQTDSVTEDSSFVGSGAHAHPKKNKKWRRSGIVGCAMTLLQDRWMWRAKQRPASTTCSCLPQGWLCRGPRSGPFSIRKAREVYFGVPPLLRDYICGHALPACPLRGRSTE